MLLSALSWYFCLVFLRDKTLHYWQIVRLNQVVSTPHWLSAAGGYDAFRGVLVLVFSSYCITGAKSSELGVTFETDFCREYN